MSDAGSSGATAAIVVVPPPSPRAPKSRPLVRGCRTRTERSGGATGTCLQSGTAVEPAPACFVRDGDCVWQVKVRARPAGWATRDAAPYYRLVLVIRHVAKVTTKDGLIFHRLQTAARAKLALRADEQRSIGACEVSFGGKCLLLLQPSSYMVHVLQEQRPRRASIFRQVRLTDGRTNNDG